MRLVALVVVVLAGCGGGQDSGASGARKDLQCTPQASGDEAACTAKGEGCGLGPPLGCYGADPGDEVLEEDRRAREAGTLPCDCICPADIEACSMVP